MEPMPPDRPLSVTLAAQEWNLVLGALGEAPWRVAQPLIQKIVGQIEGLPIEQRSNGADDHAPH